MSNSIKAR